MGVRKVLEINGKKIVTDIVRIAHNDGTDAFLIEIDGKEMRKSGIDMEEFKEGESDE